MTGSREIPGDDSPAVRGRRFWEFAFVGVLAATCVVVAATDNAGPIGKTVAVALLLGQVPAYLLLGRAALMRDPPHPRRFHYLVLVVALFVPATVFTPTAGFALFALAPLTYMVVHPTVASGTVAILSAGQLMSIAFDEEATWEGTVVGIAAVIVGVILSFAFGMWIHRVFEQSQERARLIERLAETRAELAAVSKHAGALEERRHMAREIHDTLAQGFTGIGMLLQAAEAEPENSDRYIRLAKRAAQDNLDDARALVSGSLDTVRLAESLRRVSGRLREELGIDIHVEVGGRERQLSPHVEISLLRVAQEALANARKHSNADTIHIELSFEEGFVRLEVRDDGSGFDTDTAHDGYGLSGMRERLTHLNGRFKVTSAKAAGTTVSVEVAA